MTKFGLQIKRCGWLVKGSFQKMWKLNFEASGVPSLCMNYFAIKGFEPNIYQVTNKAMRNYIGCSSECLSGFKIPYRLLPIEKQRLMWAHEGRLA